jgi:predicted AAA+ superfamily ATPase
LLIEITRSRTLNSAIFISLQKFYKHGKRYLYPQVAWDDRMVGIVGPRGVGKTTMLLQYIKENLDVVETLYAQADDIYFANHTLLDLADDFSKNRGKYLFIDEIHKYHFCTCRSTSRYGKYS